MFDEHIQPFIVEVPFTVGPEAFSMQVIKLHETSESEHFLHFCANEREATTENLKRRIPELARKLRDSNGSFVVSCYVTGEFLDRNVAQERTDFYFDRESDLFAGDSLSRVEFEEAITHNIRAHLAPYLDEILREKRELLERIVKAEMPEYRVLLRPEYRSSVDRIPPNLSKQELEVELHRTLRDQEVQLKQRAAAIGTATVTSAEDYQAISQDLARFIEEENEIGKANLAKYILHRHRVLTVLDRFLKLDPEKRYRREDALHKIIFPKGVTSDDELIAEDKNLWIIDERLSFHWFLASDKPLSSVPGLGSTSRLEPDLVVFQGPLLFVDTRPPYQAVVVIEFKRPGRKDYRDSENPIQQLYDYVEAIKSGGKTDKDGRPITLPQNVPFYVYLVCDLVPDITRFAKSAGLTLAPDSLGYFGFNPNYGCYTEIISYSKVLEDAKKRNRVLFERLNLPPL